MEAASESNYMWTALARWQGGWFVAKQYVKHGGVYLIDGDKPHLTSLGFAPGYREDLRLRRHFASPDDIVFYPVVLFGGANVAPQSCKLGTCEPILLVAWQGVGIPDDVELWDGTSHYGGNGYYRHLHVDDLKKIEGPPPEGVF
jgi:hypothetical protein